MIVANWYDDHLLRLGSALCRMYMLHALQIRSNAFGLLLSRRNTGLMVGPQSEQTPITQGRSLVMAIGVNCRHICFFCQSLLHDVSFHCCVKEAVSLAEKTF